VPCVMWNKSKIDYIGEFVADINLQRDSKTPLCTVRKYDEGIDG
jgi:hypothetical protein